MNNELQNYIYVQLNAGTTKEAIIQSLLSNGWAQGDIDAAFANMSAEQGASVGRVNANVQSQPSAQGQQNNGQIQTEQYSKSDKRKIFLIVGIFVLLPFVIFVIGIIAFLIMMGVIFV